MGILLSRPVAGQCYLLQCRLYQDSTFRENGAAWKREGALRGFAKGQGLSSSEVARLQASWIEGKIVKCWNRVLDFA